MIYESYYIKAQASGGGSTPVGATLMKSGQTTSYRTGDDGDLEAGRATDFLTLSTNNPFGNTNRFTDELGGSTYTNNIVIDWSTYDNIGGTVLGWYRTSIGNYNWNDAIDNALTHSVGTFTTGWRLPNIKEWLSIFNYGASGGALNYTPFSGIGRYNWSSTTYVDNTTYAFRTNTTPFVMQGNGITKTTTNGTHAVRTFTVSGTTLT